MIQYMSLALIWLACMGASFFYGFEINQTENDKFVIQANEKIEKCHVLITRNGIYE